MQGIGREADREDRPNKCVAAKQGHDNSPRYSANATKRIKNLTADSASTKGQRCHPSVNVSQRQTLGEDIEGL